MNKNPFHDHNNNELDIYTVAELMDAYSLRHVQKYCKPASPGESHLNFH